MNIFVTGGSGFIGSHLIDSLNINNFVINYDIYKSRNHSRTVLGSIEDISFMEHVIKNNDIGMIYNLAGMLGTHELVDNSIAASKINIIGTLNILELCKKYNIKLVEISKPNCWVNTYTITKVAAESFVEMYRREFGVEAIVLKWFNVYGTRQPLYEEAGYTKFIPTAIVSSLKNEDIKIYGNGEQTIDLVHTKDVVDSTKAIIDNWGTCEGNTFEIGHHEISVNDCTSLIKKLTNSTSNIIHIPMRKGETENTKIHADTSLLTEKTGYKMTVDLVEGLKETIEWYKKEYLQ